MLERLLRILLSGQNQFASGGLLLIIVGGLGVYLRAVPRAFWDWLVGQTTLTITVKDDDPVFVWVKEWFLEHEPFRRIRNVDVDSTLRAERPAFIPAPGSHWFWYAGRPFCVDFYRSEDVHGWLARRHESLMFRTIGRKQSFLKQFVDDISRCHERNLVASSLFVYDEHWMKVQGYRPRLLESVILKSGALEHLVEDIRRFRGAKERYCQLGVPYHRGYLLYGPPGTGKTSLVSGLAERFRMSVYAISLTNFNDKSLATAVNRVPANSVILFEDIDCMNAGKARLDLVDLPPRPDGSDFKESLTDQFGVTLSGLLNALDGFSAPENVLFVMTTNKIETLDPALLRPGRIDYRLFMGNASEEQKMELYRRFFPETSESEAREFVELHDSAETMAEFQGLLLARQGESRPSSPNHIFQST